MTATQPKPTVRKDEHGWHVHFDGDVWRTTSWPLAMMVASVKVGCDYTALRLLGYQWRRFADGHPVVRPS